MEKYLKVFETLNSNQYIAARNVLYDPSTIDTEEKIKQLYKEQIHSIAELLLFRYEGDDDMSHLEFINGDYIIKLDDKLYEFKVIDNKFNGEFKITYQETGAVYACGNLLNNNRHGNLTYSGWEDGRVTKFAQYENGKLHGLLVLFNGEGQLNEVSQYQNGSKTGFFYERQMMGMILNMGVKNQEQPFEFQYFNLPRKSLFEFHIGENEKQIVHRKEYTEPIYESDYITVEQHLADDVYQYKTHNTKTNHLYAQSKKKNSVLIEYTRYHENTTIPCMYLFFNEQTKEYTESLYWVDGTVRYTKTSTNVEDMQNSIYFYEEDEDYDYGS